LSEDRQSSSNSNAAPERASSVHGLKEDLDRLLADAGGGPITVWRMMTVLGERAHAVVILVIASPFLVVPIPGLSTMIGLLLALLSLGIMFNAPPWLPRFAAERELSNDVLGKLVHGADRVLEKSERWFHPRMDMMLAGRMHVLIGLSLFLQCIALALPIPIPGNNIPPAIGIVMLALGMLERDGLMILLGHIYMVLLWIVLLIFGAVVFAAVQAAWIKYALPLLKAVGIP
jgi:hypothetical protein